MTKVSTGKVYTITILIQWQDGDDAGRQNIARGAKSNRASRKQRGANYASHHVSDSRRDFHIPEQSSKGRLRPTDRLVLGALRANVSEGTLVTVPISVRELVAECQISRRQVQICLKRLIEKELIERLINAEDWGSHKGCRYRIVEAM
jgi:DNA-binding MarR family transcriptional regulator